MANEAQFDDDWLPMRTAPRDGTMILITDIGNGEEACVMAAAFLLDPTSNPGAKGDFWGVSPTSYIPGHLLTPEGAKIGQ